MGLKIDNLREADIKLIPQFWSTTKGSMDKFHEKGVNDENYIAVKKVDGNQIRVIVQDGVSAISRTVSKTTGEFVDNIDKLPHLEEVFSSLPENTSLLFEAHNRDAGLESSDVGSILRCLPPKAQKRQFETDEFGGPLRAYFCDIIAYDGVMVYQMPYEKRLKLVKAIYKKHFQGHKYIDLVEYSEENVVQSCIDWIATGEEGGILMRKKAPMSLGSKKSWDTIKIKGPNLGKDMDFVITSVYPPTKEFKGKTDLSNWKYFDEEGNPVSKLYALGMHGSIGIGLYTDKGLIETGTVNSGLNEEIRLMSEEELVGKVAVIRSFSKDCKNKTLREAGFFRFHDEKNPEECTMESIFGEE